jgi:hypothetical protein
MASPHTTLIAPWSDPSRTASGQARAHVSFTGFRTLWLNTGTLCNIACPTCYIESSPRNDALLYLTLDDALPFLEELTARDPQRGCEIGLTGGEPFMNPQIIAIMEHCLAAGWPMLVLTNAMQPMQRPVMADPLAGLIERFKSSLTMRVSLDAPNAATHDQMREAGAFAMAVKGLNWLHERGAKLSIAGRIAGGDGERAARANFSRLIEHNGWAIDASDPVQLVLFPEMEPEAPAPEITPGCWSKIGLRPQDLMCAHSRMIIKRRGAARASVVACTLLPYHGPAELGDTLAQGLKDVTLSHRFCAQFCVLGGASCSA